MKGLLGQKVGMTSVFLEHGQNIPITIIKVIPNVVTNVLSKKKNGYSALQLAAFNRPDKTVSKPILGHLNKSKTSGKYFIKEIKNMIGFSLGEKINVSIFKAGEFVDVSGISKGKGFAGTIKRYNQSIGPKSHGGGGGSKPIRLTGSLGDVVSNRVFKGQTMPGQMGNVKRTIQNLEVISIDVSNNFILIKGSIPGPNKGYVIIKNGIKDLSSKLAVKIFDANKGKNKNKILEITKDIKINTNDNIVSKKANEKNENIINVTNNETKKESVSNVIQKTKSFEKQKNIKISSDLLGTKKKSKPSFQKTKFSQSKKVISNKELNKEQDGEEL